MQHILYISEAQSLNIKEGRFALLFKDEREELIHPKDVSAIVIENNYMQLSIPFLLKAVERGIPLIICNDQHQPMIYPINYYRHSELLEIINKQISWQEEKKWAAWIAILHNKINAELALLKYSQKEHRAILQIENYYQSLPSCSTVEAINTVESISARLYFSALFGNLFKRFNEDKINSALNYGYALIRSIIMVELTVKGLHPTLGIWHHSVRNRFNLADDLIEPFRSLVDQKVYALNLVEDGNNTLTKEERAELLTLLFSEVIYRGNQTHLRYAISSYINDFIKFMRNENDIIFPITYAFESEQ